MISPVNYQSLRIIKFENNLSGSIPPLAPRMKVLKYKRGMPHSLLQGLGVQFDITIVKYYVNIGGPTIKVYSRSQIAKIHQHNIPKNIFKILNVIVTLL